MLSKEQRQSFVSEILRGGGGGGTVAAVRSDGAVLTSARRDELLSAVRDGRHVEVELDVLAFEQKQGAPNRNFLRFTPSAMQRLARTAVGMPFLRDHDQSSALARAGTITAAETEKLADGHYALHERVTLSAPWAVDLALRGLISSVSIGWHPDGPMLCSSCESPVLETCFHLPGDKLETVTENGVKRKRYASRASEEAEVVEWVTTKGSITETSIVNVPAVPQARIEEIRAAVSAALKVNEGAMSPARKEGTDMMDRLARILGAATTNEDEIARRAEGVMTELQIANKDLGTVRAQLRTLEAECAVLRSAAAVNERAEFLRGGIAEGKLTIGDQDVWGNLFDANPARARELLASRPAHSATPVGAPRQSLRQLTDPEPTDDRISAELEASGADRAGVLGVMRRFGLSQADAEKVFKAHASTVLGTGEVS